MPNINEKPTLTEYLVSSASPLPSPAESDVVVVQPTPTAVPEPPAPAIISAMVDALTAEEPNPAMVLSGDVLSCDHDMARLMSHVKRIGMAAKDLHYRAKGKPFYGLHELADLAYQVESDTDQIAEIYFMGDRGIEPPRMTDVFRDACDLKVWYPRNENYFIGGLMNICRSTMLLVEGIKARNPNIKSGVCAVLDKISEHCLLAIGLLDQTMKH